MRSQEGVDMLKWAIAILLLCLLLGTTIAFFYMLYDNTDRRIDSMEKAATSSNMDRLYDLQDTTFSNTGDIGSYPLCSNIVSALQEFSEEDLLYIQTISPEGDVWVFTYGDTNIQEPGNGCTVQKSQIPVTEACRYLLAYSDCRAELSLGKYDYSTGSTSWLGDSTGLLCIRVTLYMDPQVQ